MKSVPTFALLATAVLPTISCGPPASDTTTTAEATPPAPFLGVPEDHDQKIGDEPASAQPALRGITTMTAVQTVAYDEYLRHKKDGLIKREETRGGFVYFATEDGLHVPMPGAGGGHGGAYVTVTTRYKAAVPGG